jgi:hypothetical protein
MSAPPYLGQERPPTAYHSTRTASTPLISRFPGTAITFQRQRRKQARTATTSTGIIRAATVINQK